MKTDLITIGRNPELTLYVLHRIAERNQLEQARKARADKARAFFARFVPKRKPQPEP